ncbi:ArnT family glycosyltransferase [Agaribacter flavus]|uniref:ArnT family glycosyltransferase n=1 Tax=Agaribacter flavus TaxID=1902781 RepID=A0ABV7FRM7_9ALTE
MLNTRMTNYDYLDNKRVYIFALICILYCLFPNARPDFSTFNSNDAENYLAISYNLYIGNGYTRSLSPEYYVPHTLWPPGMPILLMPAVMISDGSDINWYAVKYTIILCSLCGLLLIWHFVRGVTQSKNTADMALLLFAINPFYWHFSRTGLAEMPVFVWCVLSLLLIHRYWGTAGVQFSQKKAFTLGTVLGLGMMLKGSLIGIAFIPFAMIVFRYFSRQPLQYLKQAFLFCLGFFVIFAIWNIRNGFIDKTNLGFDGVSQVQMLFKLVVEDPESRFRTIPELIATARENITWYAIFLIPRELLPFLHLFELDQLPMGSIIFLLLSACIVALAFPLNVTNLGSMVIIMPMVLMNMLMVIGGSERYWVPISLLLMLSIIVNVSTNTVLIPYLHKLNRVRYKIVVLLPYVLSMLSYVHIQLSQPYNEREDYPEFAELLMSIEDYCRKEGGRNIVVKSRNNNAVQFVTGCQAPDMRPKLGFYPQYNAAIVRIADMAELNGKKRIISQNDIWAFVALEKN